MASQYEINITTETERLLLRHYEKEKEERKKLESLVCDLRSQIEELQSHLKYAKERSSVATERNINRNNEVPPESVQYETDEDELAKETEWVRQKSRKKRKLYTSPSPQQVDDGIQTSKEKIKVRKIPLPPPIVVEQVKDYQKFYDFLSTKAGKDAFIVKMLSGENVKVNAIDEDSYRIISKLLVENKYLWHSYENKQDRPIRVMAKNLHSSCLPERIAEDLILKGFKIINAVNKLSWKSKEPLNMFILSFQMDEDIKKIYGIKSILGCKVDIQPVKSSKLIPQCKRCQAYGHTQKYCSKEPRCVKCTGKHLTINCTKPADLKPKCVHCGEPHPANYRGCIVAKELQNMKNKLAKKKELPHVIQVPSLNKSKAVIANRNVTKNITFAQIARGSQPKQPAQPQYKQPTSDTDEKLNQILRIITSFDERLKKLECSTKIATSKPKK